MTLQPVASSYGDQIRRYVSSAVEAAAELSTPRQLVLIEMHAREVLDTVTILRAVSTTVPVDCLDLYREVGGWEPSRLTFAVDEVRAFACAAPLERVSSQLITLSNSLYAVPGLSRWANVIGDLAGQAERPLIEREVVRGGAGENRGIPPIVWAFVGLFAFLQFGG